MAAMTRACSCNRTQQPWMEWIEFEKRSNDGSPLPPPKREGPPAKQYPFTIDPFQQTSVNCLEAGEGLCQLAF
eukprot:1162019-Pelagomonas_calceolata.AAC.14